MGRISLLRNYMGWIIFSFNNYFIWKCLKKKKKTLLLLILYQLLLLTKERVFVVGKKKWKNLKYKMVGTWDDVMDE